MEPAKKIRVIITDDHELFRDGLKSMLCCNEDVTVVAEAENGRELLRLCEMVACDVILLDINMPCMNGIECATILAQQYPHLGVIMLSVFDEEEIIVSALNAGVNGYLVKNAEKKEIIEAIRTVHDGGQYFCKRVTTKLAGIISNKRSNCTHKFKEQSLTDREIKIIELICQEFTNKEIAKELFMSPRTVEGYRVKIMEKTNSKNTVGIVLYAARHKIVH